MTTKFTASSIGSERLRILIAAILAVLVLSIIYFYPFGEFFRDSDQANSFLQAQSMAAGDWTLRGWWLASPTFWTSDVPMQAALISVLGPRPIVMLIVPAILWATIVVSSILLLSKDRKWSLPGLVLIGTLLGLPILRGNEPMQMIARSPMHVSTVLYLLAMFYFTARSVENQRNFMSLACCAILTALGVASDPLILVLGVPTIALVILLEVIANRRYSHLSVIAAVVAGAFFAKVAIHFISSKGGFYAFGAPLAFVPIERLGRNIEYTLSGLLILSGANFFGRGLEAAAPLLARLPLFFLVAGTVIVSARRYLRSGADVAVGKNHFLLDQLLLVGLIINISEAMLSDLLLDAWSARYFLPTLVFSAILAARNYPRHLFSTIIVTAAFAVTVLTTAQSYTRKPPKVAVFHNETLELANWLASQSLTNGYAPYWSSSIVTVASRGLVKVRPIDVENSKIVPRRWLSQEQWFNDLGQRRPFFVLIDKSPVELQLTERPVVASFGPATRRLLFKNFEVFIYE